MATPGTDLSTYKMIHTMIRVKDPRKSIEFYKVLGLSQINRLDITEGGFSLYYLAYDSPSAPSAGRHWTDRSGVIELTHHYGSEDDDNFSVANGNIQPYLGFGHVAISVGSIENAYRKLEDAGFFFEQKLADGDSKDIAFVTDPDGYRVGMFGQGKRGPEVNATDPASYRLSHTMLRIKDPVASLNFYHEVMGMSLLRTVSREQAGLTLYHLGYTGAKPSLTVDQTEPTADSEGLVELMWTHGTENQQAKVYHDGNSDPKGFGHLCISVDDLDIACARFEKLNNSWEKRLNDTSMNDMAFMLDPDGYWIEILQNEIIKPRAHW